MLLPHGYCNFRFSFQFLLPVKQTEDQEQTQNCAGSWNDCCKPSNPMVLPCGLKWVQSCVPSTELIDPKDWNCTNICKEPMYRNFTSIGNGSLARNLVFAPKSYFVKDQAPACLLMHLKMKDCSHERSSHRGRFVRALDIHQDCQVFPGQLVHLDINLYQVSQGPYLWWYWPC